MNQMIQQTSVKYFHRYKAAAELLGSWLQNKNLSHRKQLSPGTKQRIEIFVLINVAFFGLLYFF